MVQSRKILDVSEGNQKPGNQPNELGSQLDNMALLIRISIIGLLGGRDVHALHARNTILMRVVVSSIVRFF